MAAKPQCCKNCVHLQVPPNAAGRRVIPNTKRAYPCTVPLPLVPLPASVTTAYGFRWPLDRRYMTSKDGSDCPMYEERA
jgi:hypothetical protein